MQHFYLPRTLLIGDEEVSEGEVLARSSLIVILAEPGAGKTDLLTYLALSLDTTRIRASIFKTRQFGEAQPALVVDAMDEVARTGESALHDIIEKARSLSTGHVVFASRSGEWEEARSRFVEDCFGKKPLLVRVRPLIRFEQRALFAHWFPDEGFDRFEAEVGRFDLSPLLGNPEFLNILGNAYIEDGRVFTSKAQIYASAARRLALEHNPAIPSKGRLAAQALTDLAGELFAKLLLSGATGLSRTERFEDGNFPSLAVLSLALPGSVDALLDTKLLKPATDSDQHEPVHRIIAEYLAGRYLARRIDDAGDRLSLRRCMSIIAPNGAIRDELRGMLGWLAAMGGPQLQREAITVDPYGVLANGDPAQLSLLSKRYLLERLHALANEDPNFRRSDRWRTFNVGQFLSEDIVDELKAILVDPGSPLRDLMLDLLEGTEAAGQLAAELVSIAEDGDAQDFDRIAAMRVLIGIASHDHRTSLDRLIEQGTATSLRMASEVVLANDGELSLPAILLDLLRACARLYPKNRYGRENIDGSHFFIRQLIGNIPIEHLTELLDVLSSKLWCECTEDEWNCGCRRGLSSIIGGLLDRYFELVPGPHDAATVWKWTKELRFSRDISPDRSAAVRVLSTDHPLRRAIHLEAYSGLTYREEIRAAEKKFYWSHVHSGLRYQAGDWLVTANHAFDHDNSELWASVFVRHSNDNRSDHVRELRAAMRKHAQQKAQLLAIWARYDRSAKDHDRQHHLSWGGRRRLERREASLKERNRLFLHENQSEIEAGRQWGWLEEFANRYLSAPDKLGDMVDDLLTVDRALENGIDALTDHVPSLTDLGKGEWTHVARVLHACALHHYRKHGSVDHLPINVLAAVKTDSGGYAGIPAAEAKEFESAIDRVLFDNLDAAEDFARAFIEPGFSGRRNPFTRVEMLRSKEALRPLAGKLAIDWLKSFPKMPSDGERTLFEIAVRERPGAELQAIISDRLSSSFEEEVPTNGLGSRRAFWLLNSFFYQPESSQAWEELRSYPEGLLLMEARVDRYAGDERGSTSIRAKRIGEMLDHYVEQWPPVSLPNSYGSDSPEGEKAYRFLRNLVWRLGADQPEYAIEVLNRLLADSRFTSYRSDMLAVRASSIRKLALREFLAPSPVDVVSLLANRGVATVQDLRALLIEGLDAVQAQIRSADTNPLRMFHDGDARVDENTARDRIVDLLRGWITAQQLSQVIEHHVIDGNRCDFTTAATTMTSRLLLMTEVKGQWHRELFTAISGQLVADYAIHPDAAGQGVYLVLWFGAGEKVAGRVNKKIKSADALREAVVDAMPAELSGLIDVYVMDVSKRPTSPRKRVKR